MDSDGVGMGWRFHRDDLGPALDIQGLAVSRDLGLGILTSRKVWQQNDVCNCQRFGTNHFWCVYTCVITVVRLLYFIKETT